MTIHRWARWGNLGLALLLSLILLWLWWGLEGDVAQASTLKQGGPPILGEHCVDVGPLPLPPADWCGCVWGAVYVNGQPQAGAVVTLARAGLTAVFTTGLYADWPAPYFALDGRGVGAVYGDWLTVTAAYSGQTVSRVYRAFPQAPAQEQWVNLVFPEAAGAPPTALDATAAVTGTRLMLNGAGVDNDEGGAAMVGYEWWLERDGVVATTATALLPLAQLTGGFQTVVLRTLDDEGAWSAPLTRTAWVGVVTPTAVTLSGPDVGWPDAEVSFSAQLSPLTTTAPITYTWEATDQPPVIHVLDTSSDTLTLRWSTAGFKTVRVTVANAGGGVSETRVVTMAVPDLISVTVPVGDDTYVASRYPDLGFWTNQPLYVGYNTTNDRERARTYLKFALPAPLPGTVLIAAELQLYQYTGDATEPYTTEIYRVIGDWSEASALTWNTQPALSPTVYASATVTPEPAWKVWDITTLVREWYRGVPNHGLSLWARPETAAGGVFRAKESGMRPPVLQLTFASVPLTLAGPQRGLLNRAYAFTATVAPTMTQPITYTWQASQHSSPLVQTGGVTATAVFSWATPGGQTVTVTATNGQLTVPRVYSLVTAPATIFNLWLELIPENNVSVRMIFDALAAEHWWVTERLTPTPAIWSGKLGPFNGESFRRPIVDYALWPTATLRTCLGVSDTDPGEGAALYEHDGNRCFLTWLDPQSPPTLHTVEVFNVYGQVLGPDGEPLAGALVMTHDGYTATTDVNGAYRFRLLPTGRYTLTVEKAGYVFSPTWRVAQGGPPYNVRGQDFIGEAPPAAEWLALLYLDGDDPRLGDWMEHSLARLRAQTIPTAVIVLALLDGAGSHDTRLYAAVNGVWSALHPAWYQDELNMGSLATLQQFVQWGLTAYAPTYTYLALADHGGGVRGLLWDQTSGDYLTPTELVSFTQTLPRQLDVVQLDACLMGMAEIAAEFQEHAAYLVAAENLAFGVFAYDEYLAPLPTLTPRDFARHLADTYDAHPLLAQYPRTIAALDLGQAGALATAVHSLTTALLRTDYALTLSVVLTEVQHLDFTAPYLAITPQDEAIDLYHFAALVAQAIDDAEVQAAAQAVMARLMPGAAGSFVVQEHHASGTYYGAYWDLDQAHGLALYYPARRDSPDYASYATDPYAFPVTSGWLELLRRYMGEPDGTPGSLEPPPVPLPTYRLFLPLTLKVVR